MSPQTSPEHGARPAPRTRSAGRNLPAAIGVGLGLFVAVVASLAWWQWGFIALVCLALGLGVVELHRALARAGAHTEVSALVAGTVAMVAGSYWVGQHPGAGLAANTLIIGLLALTALACLVLRLRGGQQGYVRDVSASLFTLAYLPLLGSSIALMLAGERGVARIVTFIVCVVASDTGGYIAGVLFGRHPMAPVVSPKKTWEGFAGSISAGIILGICCTHWLLAGPWWVGAVLGVLLVCFGTCGDLVESMVKRDLGIKDMSNFLPGHGGVMDRLDSLLVAAPVALFAMYLMIPGG